MNHKYDLFEKFPDGSSLWRACVVGLKGTRQHMLDLSQQSPNRFYAMHLQTGKIVSDQLLSGILQNNARAGRRSRAAAV